MDIDIKMHIVKYWQSISTLSNNNTSHQAYEEHIELSQYKERTWSTWNTMAGEMFGI